MLIDLKHINFCHLHSIWIGWSEIYSLEPFYFTNMPELKHLTLCILSIMTGYLFISSLKAVTNFLKL